MKFKTKTFNFFGNMFQTQIPENTISEIEMLKNAILKGKNIVVEITPERKKRSLTCNSYLWLLCQKLAEELSKNGIVTKEDVYREAIRKCSIKPFIYPVKDEAVKRWTEIWQTRGIGWVTEDYGKAKTPGYTLIASYPGSSTFDTAEMARLIDYIVSECKDYGIETRPQAEIDSLLKEWTESNERDRKISTDA